MSKIEKGKKDSEFEAQARTTVRDLYATNVTVSNTLSAPTVSGVTTSTATTVNGWAELWPQAPLL